MNEELVNALEDRIERQEAESDLLAEVLAAGYDKEEFYAAYTEARKRVAAKRKALEKRTAPPPPVPNFNVAPAPPQPEDLPTPAPDDSAATLTVESQKQKSNAQLPEVSLDVFKTWFRRGVYAVGALLVVGFLIYASTKLLPLLDQPMTVITSERETTSEQSSGEEVAPGSVIEPVLEEVSEPANVDGQIEQLLQTALLDAQTYRESTNTFAGVCASEAGINTALRSAYDSGSDTVYCRDDMTWYVAEAELADETFYCIDSTGYSAVNQSSRQGFETCR